MTSIVHPDPAIASGIPRHLYNDDLLIDERSRHLASIEFPTLFHVLDNPELRDAFAPSDEQASSAKRRSQRAGIYAVVLAVLSLAGASAEPIWPDLPSHWSSIVAMASASCGLAAAIIAVIGVLHGTEKDEWLLQRFRSERLRQFHFQAFIWRLAEIADSCRSHDASASRRYQLNRRIAVEAFVHRLGGHADNELAAVLAPTGGDRLWLYDATDAPPEVPPGFDAVPVFNAYRRLRFDEQIGYAEHKLRSSNVTAVLRRGPLRNQQRALRGVWIGSFSLLVGLHAVLVVGHVAGWQAANNPLVHVWIIWLALIALGAKTLEEGLQLSREIERYEDYKATVADALQRFNRARTTEQQLRAMMDMERISFEEMRSFLRTANESSFVL